MSTSQVPTRTAKTLRQIVLPRSQAASPLSSNISSPSPYSSLSRETHHHLASPRPNPHSRPDTRNPPNPQNGPPPQNDPHPRASIPRGSSQPTGRLAQWQGV
ncbi:hypothetical protein LZ32DRAFT_606731 [Colletotrichum eremochloae]|nr:hypothetical protein LZ32DRAFT_606731 [Colletotrichum eremochloae]